MGEKLFISLFNINFEQKSCYRYSGTFFHFKTISYSITTLKLGIICIFVCSKRTFIHYKLAYRSILFALNSSWKENIHPLIARLVENLQKQINNPNWCIWMCCNILCTHRYCKSLFFKGNGGKTVHFPV